MKYVLTRLKCVSLCCSVCLFLFVNLLSRKRGVEKKQYEIVGRERESMRGDICAILSIIKIHWESKETYHFFRATVTTIHLIIIIHIWIQISYSSPYEAHGGKNEALLVSNRRKLQWNHNRSLKKKNRNCLLSELHAISEHSIGIHSVSMMGLYR